MHKAPFGIALSCTFASKWLQHRPALGKTGKLDSNNIFHTCKTIQNMLLKLLNVAYWEDRVLLWIDMNRATTFSTRLHVHQAKTQVSLRIRTVWSESSLSAWGRWVTTKTLILSDCGCTDWSESSLGVQAILQETLCPVSYHSRYRNDLQINLWWIPSK